MDVVELLSFCGAIDGSYRGSCPGHMKLLMIALKWLYSELGPGGSTGLVLWVLTSDA